MIQLSWLWLRHQPQSALSQWFTARVQSSEEEYDRGAGTQIVGCSMEICDRRRCHRGRCVKDGLTIHTSQIPQSSRRDQSWRIQRDEPIRDMASKAAAKNGLVLLSLCRNASGIMVSRPARQPNVSLNRQWKQARSREQAQPWMPKDRTEGKHAMDH